MTPTSPGAKLTYDDFRQFPDDGMRHELLGGEHYVTPSPNWKHQLISGNLSGMIWSYLKRYPIGRVFAAPFDVIFSNLDVVEPDLLYLSRKRMGEIETSPWVRGAPDLVVEIGSPATRQRDETVKLHLYEQFGVEEYWIVDPERDAIEVYRRVGERYERAAELLLENRDTLTSPLFPGLALPLAEIFED